MDVIGLLQENMVLTIGLGVVIVLLLLFVYKIDGFVALLGKAVGTVLQQLCSLVIEAVCLVFKVINSLEIYIVLLIDALTGKTSSNGKIASLAIGVLSVASFYTTYSGMQYFVEQKSVAFLITLGIQAILLSTSLRINDVLNLEDATKNMFSRGKWVLGAGIICGSGCITAYLFQVISLSYSVRKVLYHILYMIVIVSAIIIVFSLIMELIKTGIRNCNVGIFLFVIYFCVLSVSSFFSYNAFVPIMYPESVRSIDSFQSYRLGIIDLLEQADKAVDNDYYERVKEELEIELQKLEQALESLDDAFLWAQIDQELYSKQNAFEEYIRDTGELAKLEKELAEEEKAWKEEEAVLFSNSGGVGKYTTSIWSAKKDAHDEKVEGITDEIESLNDKLDKVDARIKLNAEAYQNTMNEVEVKKEAFDCSDEIALVRMLLKQEEWSADTEKEAGQAVLKLENARLNLSAAEGVSNNFRDMLEVYHGYQVYRKQYHDIENHILCTAVEQDLYAETYEQIQALVYDLLQSLPETKYVFYDAGHMIQTSSLPKSEYYSMAETLKRNADPNLSQIEKNIRTFIGNKMIGIVCAMMALLIDMMILFVGIILPKDIHFSNNSEGRYSDQEIRRVLSNLFNKPIRR